MNIRRRITASGLALAAGASASLGLGLATPTTAGATLSRGVTFVARDTLVVLTGSTQDSVAIRLAPGSTTELQVDLGDDGRSDFSADRSRFSHILVSLGSGADRFRIDQANGLFADEAVLVDGGSGNDTLNGGDNLEWFVGGSGDDLIDGNKGNDAAHMGSGDDVFVWDPGDGSDLVEGQSGTDALDFNGAAGAEQMQLVANGSRTSFLRVQGNIVMDMDDVEELDLDALGGVDEVTIGDLTGTDMRRSEIDLGVPPGTSDTSEDVVTVQGTARADNVAVGVIGSDVSLVGLPSEVTITGSAPTDRLQLNTLAGNDAVRVADGVAARITANVDLGTDQVV